VQRAVIELELKLAAGVGPGFLCFPDVAVLVRGRIISQAAAARAHGLLDTVDWDARLAGDRQRLGVARRQDRQPLVAVQAELHRHAFAGIDLIQHRQIVDRRQKARVLIGRHLGLEHAFRAVGEGRGESQRDAVQAVRTQAQPGHGLAGQLVADRDDLAQRAGQINAGLATVAQTQESRVLAAGAEAGKARKTAGAARDGRAQVGDRADGIAGGDGIRGHRVDADLARAGADEADEAVSRSQIGKAGKGAGAARDDRAQVGEQPYGLAGGDGISGNRVDANLARAGADETDEAVGRSQIGKAGEGAGAARDGRAQVGERA